jgi:hypothetical protein
MNIEQNIELQGKQAYPDHEYTRAIYMRGLREMHEQYQSNPSEFGMVKKEDYDDVKRAVELLTEKAAINTKKAKHADQLAEKLGEWINAYDNKEDMSDLYEESALLVINVQEPDHYPTEKDEK